MGGRNLSVAGENVANRGSPFDSRFKGARAIPRQVARGSANCCRIGQVCPKAPKNGHARPNRAESPCRAVGGATGAKIISVAGRLGFRRAWGVRAGPRGTTGTANSVRHTGQNPGDDLRPSCPRHHPVPSAGRPRRDWRAGATENMTMLTRLLLATALTAGTALTATARNGPSSASPGRSMSAGCHGAISTTPASWTNGPRNTASRSRSCRSTTISNRSTSTRGRL